MIININKSMIIYLKINLKGETMKIYSWNVNGIRAVANKGELDNFFDKFDPEILCIQETKAQAEQIADTLLERSGYHSYIMDASRKGYSGVLVYTKIEPLSVRNSQTEYDDEGRYIELEYPDFTLINCYFPNSQDKGKRIDYKIGFNEMLRAKTDELTAAGVNVIVTGDYNVAHNEIDLKNPKTNTKNAGFLPEEREWMTKFLDNGMIDTFRYLYPEEVKYSWWSYRFQAREKNTGWRIDYFCVNHLLKDNLVDAQIHNDVYGSDHCPVSVELSF